MAKAEVTPKRNITINEAMSIMKQLKDRHQELIGLRNTNSADKTRYFGANADKNEVIKVVYDIKKLDKLVNQVAKEIRMLDLAIRATNQSVTVVGYEFSEDVFGEVV